ncbi:MAG: dihydrolipoamide acetyltransferase family protein [Actinomycetes bacterium]
MLREFKLPDVGEGLTEAEIVRWHVAPGDPVRVNQTIVEIETAKAVVELPCPFEGVVAGLLAAEGDTVEVGTPIIQVETEPDAAPAPGGGADARQGAPAPAAAEEPRAVAETGGAASGEAAEEETGGRRPVLVGYGVKVGATRRRPRRPGPGRGPAGTAPAAPSFPGTQAAPPVRPAAPAAPGRITTLAKPPVRKLAKDLGVDLATVTGTGPNGTITREDVRRAAAGTAPAAPVAPAAPQAAPREERIPVKGVRKAMATAMVASAFSVPHVTEFLQVDVTATVDAVARLRAMPDFADVKVSPLLLVARALITAARRHPLINSSWDGEEIVVKHYVNLGIAVATERGLVVPNIKDAQDLSLPGLAKALTELTVRAREGRTQPAEMTGGTITITNVGVFGVDAGTPIINPGEAAILAFGQIRDMPWVVDGAIVPRKVCTLALSFDHRIIDGELGSAVLREVGAMLEDPLRLLAWS